MNKMVFPSFADAPNPAVQPRPARIVDFARCMSEAAGAVRLLNRQKFDIVISDPQLGDQCGPILDAVGLSASNRTAVTFAINGSDADASATFRRRTGFVFGKLSSCFLPHLTRCPVPYRDTLPCPSVVVSENTIVRKRL